MDHFMEVREVMRVKNQKGQNMIEYILIFVAVILVILLAISPQGFYTQSVNKTLELSVNTIGSMAQSLNYDYGP